MTSSRLRPLPAPYFSCVQLEWIKSSLRPSIKTLLKIAVATGLLTSPFWSNALVNSGSWCSQLTGCHCVTRIRGIIIEPCTEIEIGFVVREREKLITELLATLANPKETSANRIGALDRLLDLAHSGCTSYVSPP
jgi:hypothetical protein